MLVTISHFLVLEAFFLSGLVRSCGASDTDEADEAKVGWVWDVSDRSTFEVLWSCLAVILVCTYKVVHLNILAEKETDASWHELMYWKKWLRKLKWMGFMALSPELLLSMAMLDWLWSRDSVRKFKKAGLKGASSLLSPSKPMADIIESIEGGQATSITRSMPSHVPLRYTQTRLEKTFFTYPFYSAWTTVHAHYANMSVPLSICNLRFD